MTRAIYKTTVAVVGGAGFLGSHLVNHLVSQRMCKVIVVDNLVVGSRGGVQAAAQFVHHDITGSEEYLRNVFKANNVQYVFNYAAYPYVPDSFARPLRVCDVNFMGAMKVINAAHESGTVKAILQVSSAEIYGDAGQRLEQYQDDPVHVVGLKIDEKAPINPHSSYGASKAAVDFYCQVAARERGVPVISLRQFNCLGERESHPYVVPEIIGQLTWRFNAAGKKTALVGVRPGETVGVRLGNNSFRDFLYAGDAVEMAAELLEKGQFGEVYNLGSEEGVQIYDLAGIIGEVMGRKVTVSVDEKRIRPWEIWHLQSNNAKIYDVIKKRPRVSLQQAIARTIMDYRDNGFNWSWETP